MEELEFGLFEKYLRKEASDPEILKVEAWLRDQGFDAEDLKLLMSPSRELKLMLSVDAKKDWALLKERLQGDKSNRTVRMFPPVWRMAASFLLIALAISAIYFLVNNTHSHVKNVANHNTQYIKESLPDGSVAFLNAGAELTYEENFKNNRTVFMKGEVFFEVTPDANHPFVINTQHIRVKVVGTSFQVDAEQAEVIVTTGKVLLEHPGVKAIHLESGERGTYNNDQRIIFKEKNNDLNFLSWKTGILVFQNTPVDKVVADLEAYFDIKITFEKPQGVMPAYTSRFERPSLKEVLEEMKLTLPIEYSVTGKHVVLTIN